MCVLLDFWKQQMFRDLITFLNIILRFQCLFYETRKVMD